MFGTKLETTYEEWEKGPYNSDDPKKRVTCQGCHMYQQPGIPATGSTPRPKNKGLASDDGPVRDHIFTHYFVGGNSYVPNDKIKQKMAEERLKHSAVDYHRPGANTKRAIDTRDKKYRRRPLSSHRADRYSANVAGNYSQTTKRAKQSIHREGWTRINTSPKERLIFNTVFGDGEGNPTHNISKAREILLDKRISPYAID